MMVPRGVLHLFLAKGFSFHSEDLLMAALKVLKKLMLCISPR